MCMSRDPFFYTDVSVRARWRAIIIVSITQNFLESISLKSLTITKALQYYKSFICSHIKQMNCSWRNLRLTSNTHLSVVTSYSDYPRIFIRCRQTDLLKASSSFQWSSCPNIGIVGLFLLLTNTEKIYTGIIRLLCYVMEGMVCYGHLMQCYEICMLCYTMV